MTTDEFRRHGHTIVDWIADFYDEIEQYPVKSQVKPGEIKAGLPAAPPERSEDFETMFRDFQDRIMPGITHWQHPSFFAYFPANGSFPSILGEMLTAALGAQCMIWQTSPAAAELEERVMEWLRDMTGLPEGFEGVIQDTASTSTLCSILTAREKVTDYGINERGFEAASGSRAGAEQDPGTGAVQGVNTGAPQEGVLTVYGSAETHSSIEKAVKIAGLGKENLRKVPVDSSYAMVPEELERAIEKDKAAGCIPCCVVATIGTTGSTAVDPLRRIGEICRKHGVWLHVDAALAGTALLLPEYRWMIDGIEFADTFVFNPHKWMFTNFDCSAYFVKDREALIKTFEIHPEYLKTKEGTRVKNYRDWGVQLGRRFRALKLWFVIRSFGVEGLKERIKYHLDIAARLAERIEEHEEFELLAPVPLNTVCFRCAPRDLQDEESVNALNERLLETLNGTGKMYVTHTKLGGKYTIRLVVGQTRVEERHVEAAWELIRKKAEEVRGQ